ncbi:hypothetical protein [Paraburkholderia azotifigens]|uniref:Uncharacterized protein n=1 Tax=Paraburkholderia azotifigens TaxID=2057004 RepID=A0A5C6VNY4_9BURK|nr:hypothetical protein [Paraburkholderia azotifigens]TXC86897.1 hypothetical protein FRZ40_04495 [Paraburkholderia azotifigens]
MSHRPFSTAIVPIHSNQPTRRRSRVGVLLGARQAFRAFPPVRKFAALIVGAGLSMALSGCGVFCGIAGGSGGFGGNCGIGFHF